MICVFNSYSTLIKNGSDPAKVMKSKRYIERLKHKIEGINKRRLAQQERGERKRSKSSAERQKLELARLENEKNAALYPPHSPHSLLENPPLCL